MHAASSRAIAIALAASLALVSALGGCASRPSPDALAAHAPDAAPAISTAALLREAVEHEALFTLAGGLKPMSTGIWRGGFDIAAPDLAEIDAVRAALAPLRNDTWYADVQVFENVFEGRRSVHAYIVHRESFRAMIEAYAPFWSGFGITPGTHPSEVVAVVDRMEKADRWRGYGYMFGYPAAAVDFFVEAGLAADAGGEVGPGKDREFLQIPTYAAETGRFTYAVPLGHVPTAEDVALAAAAARVLDAFSSRSDRMRDTRSMILELKRLNTKFAALPSVR